MWPFTKKPDPYVGMKLGCKTWGPNYTTIEIVQISKNKKDVLYKFLIVKGTPTSISSTYRSRYKWLYDNYALIV